MTQLQFLLNDRPVGLRDVGASDTLLDHLRLARRLTGTKEGCAEGDCGACTVLSGRLTPEGLIYEPVNACIRLLASCHATHIVTIEHLRGPQGGAGDAGMPGHGGGRNAGPLHPVQQAMVDHHGSQCGFCTPGIVMALYGLWMADPDADARAIERALQGNICRCTGYEPIIRAALAAGAAGGQARDALALERAAVTRALAAMRQGGRVTLSRGAEADAGQGSDRAIIPCDTDDLAQALLAEPQATLVAGATDVGLWVTKFMRDISPAIFIGHLMKEIAVTDGMLSLGAGVTYSEAAPLIARHIPEAHDYWLRIGGWQVRNMGTIGANIANGSPIGDTPPLLIALGARIVLRRGDARRDLALEDFFIDYGKQDRAPGEFVERILIPLPATAGTGAARGEDGRKDAREDGGEDGGPRTLIAAYKITKRRDSDITAVAAGFCLQVEGGIITGARLAFGGMAATPKRAAGAEAALRGQPFTQASLDAAAQAVDGDFQPLSDMRASAAYRATVARNLFRRFWLEQGAGADPDRPVRLNHAVPQALRQPLGAEATPSLGAGE